MCKNKCTSPVLCQVTVVYSKQIDTTGIGLSEMMERILKLSSDNSLNGVNINYNYVNIFGKEK